MPEDKSKTAKSKSALMQNPAFDKRKPESKSNPAKTEVPAQDSLAVVRTSKGGAQRVSCGIYSIDLDCGRIPNFPKALFPAFLPREWAPESEAGISDHILKKLASRAKEEK